MEMEVAPQPTFNRGGTTSTTTTTTTTTAPPPPMRKHHKGRGHPSRTNPRESTTTTTTTSSSSTAPLQSSSPSAPPPPPPPERGAMVERGNSGMLPSKPRGRSANKTSHSRSYPRGVGLDFRKLAGITLMSYIDHHGVNVRSEAPPSELAVAVARHFESTEVDEELVIGGFLSRLTSSTTATYSRQTSHFDGTASSLPIRKRRRSKNAARPGEQVAAKVTRTDENGSWILASVQRFYSDTETYDVQDEDDTSKLIRLPWNHVMRLSTGDIDFRKGSNVMAIFPETTSFYRAEVSKQPIWKLTPGATTPIVKELIVKFEDDEDENGRTPHRRVPSRYVIPLPKRYFHEDEDDVDLRVVGTASG